MELDVAKKVPLNRYTHSVRASQAVLQYGVGAMVDFPNQTLMTAAPEYWKEQVIQIHDERLEKVLHVDYLGLPAGQDDPNGKDGISYARFPEWYFCPKCRKFQPITDWVKEYKRRAKQKQLNSDPDMVKFLQCPTCRQDLVVTRIVVACECGHIDDFPWVQWVHCRNMIGGPKEVCPHPSLTFKTSASSTEGLEGLTVSCEACHARATLKGAFDKDILQELDAKYQGKYNFRCTGRHPWKHVREKCGKYPRVLQRGSSSVYFPITASSLVIPPYSSMITKKVENSIAFSKCKDAISDCKKSKVIPKEYLPAMVKERIEQYLNEIVLEIGIAADKVRPILERRWIDSENEEDYSTFSVKYRAEEYEALSGEVSLPADDYGDFLREGTNIDDYAIPHVRSISLIHKVREVQALTGFSRLKPVEADSSSDESEHIVSVKEKETNWYPAYEVRGEGIFVEFSNGDIEAWVDRFPDINSRVEVLNENYQKSFIGSSRPRRITAKFLLLHTISHLLIKQLSFECGYSIASLKERLYCSEEKDGKQMAGILIYTASGDAEGTMGGLVRQGRSDIFPGIFKKAVESAMTCSNDPVCSLSLGQGRDSLNLSSCYSCSLIPETSCEEFNVFLDRGTIVGTYENREMGFYSTQLYNGTSWNNNESEKPVQNTSSDKKRKIYFVDAGVDLRDVPYSDIWKSIKVWSDDETELGLLSELEKRADEFSAKEKPCQDCVFLLEGNQEQYKCDLYWKDSGVAFFTIDNEECYVVAKGTDVKCFFTLDNDASADALLAVLKEK